MNVQLYDVSPEQLDKGMKFMDKLLAKDVSKGKIAEIDAKEARERVSAVGKDKGIAA